MARPTDSLDWDRAREMWAAGATTREIGAAIGCSHNTVAVRASNEGWPRDEEPAGLAQTQAGRDRARVRWAERREDEADAAGITAAVARQHIVTALQAKNPQLVRAAAIAYGILIDKAQLLAGGATIRFEGHTSSSGPQLAEELERRAAELDELAQRRARHQATG